MKTLRQNQIRLAQEFLLLMVDDKSAIGQGVIALSARPGVIVSSTRPYSSLAEIGHGIGYGNFDDVLAAAAGDALRKTRDEKLLIWDNGFRWSDVRESERGAYEASFLPDVVQAVSASPTEEFSLDVKAAVRRCRSFTPLGAILSASVYPVTGSTVKTMRWAAVSCFDQEGAIIWRAPEPLASRTEQG